MNKPVNAFLRSINIGDDLGHPDRFAHYHPTARSAPLVAAVTRPGATMAIASYGSGKSLAAGIGALAVRNDEEARPVLGDLARRMSRVDPTISEALLERSRSDRKGAAVVLSGYVKDLAAELASALGLPPRKTVKAVVAAIRERDDVDHVAVVWDEFGRHLEGLVMDARSRDLEAVQDLAELAARPLGTTLSVTLLLHQNVLAYAQTLNQTSRNEWRKIEGRFEQMRFVEDSSELYALVAKFIRARAPAGADAILRAPIDEVVARAIEGGWFDDAKDADEVRALVESARPLSAAALQVLPRLVARVGQNERSLFGFLDALDLDGAVGTDAVYEAFSEAIRSDVGVGGLHRQWVEAESARNRAETALEREAIAAAFLLQAGASGERRHVRKSVLVGAVASSGAALAEAERAVDGLVARKLLIHRKLNDEVSVWHGADVDVATKLREQRERIGAEFDIVEFLSREHRAPFIRPIRHNVSKGVNRYLDGAFARATGLDRFLSQPFEADWGRIVYVLANTAEEARVARRVAAEERDRTVLVIPADPVSIEDAALEVEALLALRSDEDLLSKDPLVARELDELLAVARRHLAVVLHRLTTDRPTSAEWWHAGERLEVDADRPAGIALSGILDGWYPKTPRIINDQVVRTKLSRPMTTARVRMITRLMAHAGTPDLAYGPDEGAAEASVYRTVLKRTGLHVERDGRGAFAEPGDLADAALAEAWGEIKRFFTSKGVKRLDEIVNLLSAPPYGIAAGLMPILVMAGFKAYAKAAAVRVSGIAARDLLGFDSAKLFENPSDVEIEVYPGSQAVLRYLDDFARVFDHEAAGEFEEKTMFAVAAFDKWLSSVADGIKRSRRLSDEARAMLRAAQQAGDGAHFVMRTLPDLFGPPEKPYAAKLPYVIDALRSCRNGIDALVDGYLRDAVDVVTDVLALEGSGGELEWADCFDPAALSRRRDMKRTDVTVLRVAADAREGRRSREGLARILSEVLIQRTIDKWQDDTTFHFRKELREARERIEAAALDVEIPSPKMIPVIETRIRHLQAQLDRAKKGARG